MAERFHIATLGCKINQYESQALREAWQGRGMVETEDPAEAGLLLVNSCAVTARAVRDLRQTVRRLNREAPQGRIMVTGCAAALLREELLTMDGVCRVVDQRHKPLLREPDTVPPFAPCADFGLQIAGFQRARAVLKVQDGCSHGCSYCIVPLSRGPARSRPFPDVLQEARRLLASGVRELVLSGVNLRQYRHEGRDFWELLTALDCALAPDWRGKARLRLSSLEPGQLDARGVESLAACELLCPHLHVSLQSGSPDVLTRMGRRHYGPEHVLQGVALLERHFPLLGLGADLLVGFPGEDAQAFAETLELAQALPLSYAHVFPYSRRPGTAAALMPKQTPHKEKTRRAALLRQTVQTKTQAFLQQLAKRPRLRVLVETLEPEASGTSALGRCEYYAPVRLQGPVPPAASRGLVTARPCAVHGDTLLAEVLPEQAP